MSDYDPNYVPTYALYLIGVKTIIYNEKGEILLLKRSGKSPSPHTWDFPGGGVDNDENPNDTALREIAEETTLNVGSLSPISVYENTDDTHQYVVIGYTAEYIGGSVSLSWEHEAYEWMSLDTVSNLGLRHLHQSIFDAYLKTLS